MYTWSYRSSHRIKLIFLNCRNSLAMSISYHTLIARSDKSKLIVAMHMCFSATTYACFVIWIAHTINVRTHPTWYVCICLICLSLIDIFGLVCLSQSILTIHVMSRKKLIYGKFNQMIQSCLCFNSDCDTRCKCHWIKHAHKVVRFSMQSS